MRVGLNLVYLIAESGGSGTYARELIPAMLALEPETRITAFVNAEAPADVLQAPWAGEVEWVRLPVRVSGGPPWNFALTMASQWGAIPALAAKRRLDVVHGLANIAPLVVPGVTKVVTLLDLIWMRFPQTMARRATIGMKIVAPTSARAANRVIAISESAKRDLVDRIGLDPGKIDVTHLGIRADEHPAPTPEEELRGRFDLGDGPLVFCVAQKREHKNLARLVRAVASLEDASVRLILPGSPTPHEGELRQLAAQLGAAERLKTPGWVSTEDLEGLYRAAACFVLPSFEEGFGLPLLEAMARGAPVACSNVSSLPEVAGEAALYFDPTREDEIAAAIRRLIEDRDLAVRLAAKGRERCAEFTWEATARQTLATYRRAIEERGRGRYRRR